MLHLKLIACKVLQREVASLLYRCPNTVDVTMMKQSYHEVPTALNQILQEEIDRIDANDDPHSNDLMRRELDAIVLGYGLCSNAIAGLRSRKYPIVIPKAHDCATLVMGSKEAYQEYFMTYKGSYFLTRGWLELGAIVDDDKAYLEKMRSFYMAKYDDEEIVDELMELEVDMTSHYSYMTYVQWPELPDPEAEELAKKAAAQKGWNYHLMEGSSSLMQDMLWGNWDESKFLIIPPGETAKPSYDGDVICRA